mgnify:CR=1 FL=1
MTKRMAGKAALITGAAQGIGEATALRMAEEGAEVVLADRNPDKAEAVAERIRQQGGVAHVVAVDMGDRAQV